MEVGNSEATKALVGTGLGVSLISAIAVRAALTGHLMISTLHAGSCQGVFERLLVLCQDHAAVASSVELVLNQRLVRRRCKECAMESAGITLVKGDLRGIARARRLSRATMRNVRQNLFLAFGLSLLVLVVWFAMFPPPLVRAFCAIVSGCRSTTRVARVRPSGSVTESRTRGPRPALPVRTRTVTRYRPAGNRRRGPPMSSPRRLSTGSA